jgi:IS1 family transposase
MQIDENAIVAKANKRLETADEEDTEDIQWLLSRIDKSEGQRRLKNCATLATYLKEVRVKVVLTDEQVAVAFSDSTTLHALLNKYEGVSIPRTEGRSQEALQANIEAHMKASEKGV